MPPGPSSAMTIKRIHREIADLKKEDLGSMTLEPSDDNLHVWKGSIPGPQGSVYEGGVFYVEITLPSDYPFSAPKVIFKTRIYHMNISEQGNICIDILKNNWSPALSLFKVMLSLSSLLTDPNPKDPLVASIANQYTRNRKGHDETARKWTQLYAKPKPVLSTVQPQAAPSASTSRPQQARNQTSSGPSRERGKRKQSIQNDSNNTSRSGSSGAAPVIVIEDDDSAAAKGKRKRAEQSSSEVINLADEEGEGSVAADGASKRRRTTRNNAGRSTTLRQDDVIVIEDD